mmetsp:Transcript_23498/g.55664  ORF Transcript_23498/g.55664 Transcript_23498/m.55664 type:complete len:216 (-) Transcript_23498:219-866(-)
MLGKGRGTKATGHVQEPAVRGSSRGGTAREAAGGSPAGPDPGAADRRELPKEAGAPPDEAAARQRDGRREQHDQHERRGDRDQATTQGGSEAAEGGASPEPPEEPPPRRAQHRYQRQQRWRRRLRRHLRLEPADRRIGRGRKNDRGLVRGVREPPQGPLLRRQAHREEEGGRARDLLAVRGTRRSPADGIGVLTGQRLRAARRNRPPSGALRSVP